MESASLKERLFHQHEQEMVHVAKMIFEWRPGPERTEAAESHVRQALFESPSRIREETKYRVYSILSFVLPNDVSYVGEEPPTKLLEQEAEWELG